MFHKTVLTYTYYKGKRTLISNMILLIFTNNTGKKPK